MGCRDNGRCAVNQCAFSFVRILLRKKNQVYLTEIRLSSCLSPNGHHISTAKHGGYDLYNLDTGIVLHTFAHDLHVGIDKYPTTFLPGGFAFCGATIDGTVTIWGVKDGDQLQSVQHLCASRLSRLFCNNPDFPQAGVTVHTLAVRYICPRPPFSMLTPVGICCEGCWRCISCNSIF